MRSHVLEPSILVNGWLIKPEFSGIFQTTLWFCSTFKSQNRSTAQGFSSYNKQEFILNHGNFHVYVRIIDSVQHQIFETFKVFFCVVIGITNKEKQF